MQLVCPHCAALNRVADNRPASQANCGKCHKSLFTASALPVSQAMFDRMLTKSDLPMVVDFWADWCGPCKMIAPILEQVAEEYKDRLILAKLDVEENQNIATQYAVRSIPTLMLFKGGDVQVQHVGMLSKGQLGQLLEGNL